MRLWHPDVLPYLPRQQLAAQWRELNLIFYKGLWNKKVNHILINYIYNNGYHKEDLLMYTLLVDYIISTKQGYKLNREKMLKYFNLTEEEYFSFYQKPLNENPFKKYHNDEYLKICCWNLYEKYLRGQKGFRWDAIAYIKGVCYHG